MAGTLTTSAGASSFRSFTNGRFSPESFPTESTSNVHIRNRTAPKAALHAVIDGPAVESPTIKSMSLYEVLRVNRNATTSEIKTAYRSLAKRYHPDAVSGSNRNDDRDFIDIRNAYATLSDPTARALYDLKLSTGFERRSGLYTGAGMYAGRRWETDQCW